MLIGLATLVFKFGTLDFVPIFGTASSVLTKDAATVIALLLFAGAIGKSAQLPLQVWLPDAMAGPTPVSALIHAATMVTAGVYLVIRSHVLFEISGVALTVVARDRRRHGVVRGTCAIAQFDIKRVLAYSTISQLGYMFIAVGMRAYAVAMFFLVAHAFYKALMFLGAGSVIHGMDDEQDMRQMGGLRKAMPITFATFLSAPWRRPGIPPLAGFFAKDALLEVASTHGRTAVHALGTLAAVPDRVLHRPDADPDVLRRRRDRRRAGHAHESSPVLVAVPLAILAGLAVLAGLLDLPPERQLEACSRRWPGVAEEGTHGLATPLVFEAIAVAITILGAASSRGGSTPRAGSTGRRFRARLEPFATRRSAGWYVDRAYDVGHHPTREGARRAHHRRRRRHEVIDGAVNGVAGAVKRAAQRRPADPDGLRAHVRARARSSGRSCVLGFIGVRV